MARVTQGPRRNGAKGCSSLILPLSILFRPVRTSVKGRRVYALGHRLGYVAMLEIAQAISLTCCSA